MLWLFSQFTHPLVLQDVLCSARTAGKSTEKHVLVRAMGSGKAQIAQVMDIIVYNAWFASFTHTESVLAKHSHVYPRITYVLTEQFWSLTQHHLPVFGMYSFEFYERAGVNVMVYWVPVGPLVEQIQCTVYSDHKATSAYLWFEGLARHTVLRVTLYHMALKSHSRNWSTLFGPDVPMPNKIFQKKKNS